MAVRENIIVHFSMRSLPDGRIDLVFRHSRPDADEIFKPCDMAIYTSEDISLGQIIHNRNDAGRSFDPDDFYGGPIPVALRF